jgi:hypothetical protein
MMRWIYGNQSTRPTYQLGPRHSQLGPVSFKLFFSTFWLVCGPSWLTFEFTWWQPTGMLLNRFVIRNHNHNQCTLYIIIILILSTIRLSKWFESFVFSK